MSKAERKQPPMVRINVILPPEERRAFDKACNADPKTTMNWRIRELIAADAAGEIDLPRTPPPVRGKPQVKGPRGSPVPPRRKGK